MLIEKGGDEMFGVGEVHYFIWWFGDRAGWPLLWAEVDISFFDWPVRGFNVQAWLAGVQLER